MTRDRCLQQLLSLYARAALEGNLPSVTTLTAFHNFMSTLDALETSSPVYALGALTDWVTRILQGIADSTPTTSVQPLVLLPPSQQSTTYMDLVEDAMAPVPIQLTPAVPELRFTVIFIMSHRIVREKLSYWVQWEGTEYYEPEVYANLHHLEIFRQYEIRLAASTPLRARTPAQKFEIEQYQHYIRLRDEAISQLIEEFDTEDEEPAEPQQQCHLASSPMEHLSSEETISWDSLLVASDIFMPTNLDLGGSFGQAGPSYQGEPFNWSP
jgi:hypothetical protein